MLAVESLASRLSVGPMVELDDGGVRGRAGRRKKLRGDKLPKGREERSEVVRGGEYYWVLRTVSVSTSVGKERSKRAPTRFSTTRMGTCLSSRGLSGWLGPLSDRVLLDELVSLPYILKE